MLFFKWWNICFWPFHAACAASGAVYGLLLGFTGLSCLYSCFYRSRLRGQYDLEEAPCVDCLVHFFYEPCALCQEYRELRNRGFDMGIGKYELPLLQYLRTNINPISWYHCTHLTVFNLKVGTLTWIDKTGELQLPLQLLVGAWADDIERNYSCISTNIFSIHPSNFPSLFVWYILNFNKIYCA